MIGLDTNILARYYVEDEGDAESRRQRLLARDLIESGQRLQVCKTVLLELEWVVRGYYGIGREGVVSILAHLLALPQVEVEDRRTVQTALEHVRDGFDFADALHHASYSQCREVATFDDNKFARRARRKGWTPVVRLLAHRSEAEP